MKIVGFNINKINIERQDSPAGEVKVQSKLDIENINEEQVPFNKTTVLRFDFFFNLNYEPKLGKLEIKGSLLILDEGELKDVLKEWKSKKTFSHASKIDILNYILSKCNLKAINLEEEVGLPLHIPFPKLALDFKKEDNRAKYTG